MIKRIVFLLLFFQSWLSHAAPKEVFLTERSGRLSRAWGARSFQISTPESIHQEGSFMDHPKGSLDYSPFSKKWILKNHLGEVQAQAKMNFKGVFEKRSQLISESQEFNQTPNYIHLTWEDPTGKLLGEKQLITQDRQGGPSLDTDPLPAVEDRILIKKISAPHTHSHETEVLFSNSEGQSLFTVSQEQTLGVWKLHFLQDESTFLDDSFTYLAFFASAGMSSWIQPVTPSSSVYTTLRSWLWPMSTVVLAGVAGVGKLNETTLTLEKDELSKDLDDVKKKSEDEKRYFQAIRSQQQKSYNVLCEWHKDLSKRYHRVRQLVGQRDFLVENAHKLVNQKDAIIQQLEARLTQAQAEMLESQKAGQDERERLHKTLEELRKDSTQSTVLVEQYQAALSGVSRDLKQKQEERVESQKAYLAEIDRLRLALERLSGDGAQAPRVKTSDQINFANADTQAQITQQPSGNIGQELPRGDDRDIDQPSTAFASELQKGDADYAVIEDDPASPLFQLEAKIINFQVRFFEKLPVSLWTKAKTLMHQGYQALEKGINTPLPTGSSGKWDESIGHVFFSIRDQFMNISQDPLPDASGSLSSLSSIERQNMSALLHEIYQELQNQDAVRVQIDPQTWLSYSPLLTLLKRYYILAHQLTSSGDRITLPELKDLLIPSESDVRPLSHLSIVELLQRFPPVTWASRIPL